MALGSTFAVTLPLTPLPSFTATPSLLPLAGVRELPLTRDHSVEMRSIERPNSSASGPFYRDASGMGVHSSARSGGSPESPPDRTSARSSGGSPGSDGILPLRPADGGPVLLPRNNTAPEARIPLGGLAAVANVTLPGLFRRQGSTPNVNAVPVPGPGPRAAAVVGSLGAAAHVERPLSSVSGSSRSSGGGDRRSELDDSEHSDDGDKTPVEDIVLDIGAVEGAIAVPRAATDHARHADNGLLTPSSSINTDDRSSSGFYPFPSSSSEAIHFLRSHEPSDTRLASGSASASASASSAVAADGSATTTAPRILVVEDNIVNQLLLEQTLGRMGCSFTIVENGQLALDCLNEVGPAEFDVIFMDVSMPVMDGLEATRAIRARWPDRSLCPVIVGMTANAMREQANEYIDAGMDSVLAKPTPLDEMRAVVSAHVGRRHLVRQRLLDANLAQLSLETALS